MVFNATFNNILIIPWWSIWDNLHIIVCIYILVRIDYKSERISSGMWKTDLCKLKHKKTVALFTKILTIKNCRIKRNICLTIKILHLRQDSFTRKVRTIFTLKVIVSIFVKLFLILVLHLRQFFIIRIFVKRASAFHKNSNDKKLS